MRIISPLICEYIQVRGHLAAVYVVRPSTSAVTWPNMPLYTQETNSTSARYILYAPMFSFCWMKRYKAWGVKPKNEAVSQKASFSGEEVCDRTFARTDGLQSHLRTHTGMKPYECQICFEKMAYSSAFARHMRKHTGENPFPCEVCGKTFLNKPSLNAHQETHENNSGERPFNCKMCHKSFSKIANRNVHMKSQHRVMQTDGVMDLSKPT